MKPKPLLLTLLLLIRGAAAAVFLIAQSQPNFINVDGPDLKSRLAAAVKLGSAQRGRFWAAHTFAVRPGVAFDTMYIGSGGSAVVINGRTVSSQVETRNLGVFLLYESADRAIVRAEIYNLDRPRDYAGYPVYWLGRAPSNESLPLLRGLIDTITSSEGAQRLVDAIGAHDEPQVPTTLRDIVRTAKNERARITAVSWLGHWPQQLEFLAALARDERELTGVRREAAEAIGDSEDRGALRVLQDLYGAVTHREVKRELLESMADDRFADSALSFLIATAQRDPDRALQRAAVEAISEIETADAIAALRQLFSNANQRELKQEIVEAIADSEDAASAISFLAGVARNDSDREVRESAIEALGDMDDDRAVAALAQAYDAARDEETKDEILEALGDTESTQALEKLMAVAQRDPSVKLRRRAIALLGESEDPAAIKLLEGLIK